MQKRSTSTRPPPRIPQAIMDHTIAWGTVLSAFRVSSANCEGLSKPMNTSWLASMPRRNSHLHAAPISQISAEAAMLPRRIKQASLAMWEQG